MLTSPAPPTGTRRPLLIAGTFVTGGAAALVAVALLHRTATTARPPLQLEVRVASPLEPPHRSVPASVGDRVVARAAGADQLWIYRDRALVMRCPPGCALTAGGVELSFLVERAARYHVLAVGDAPDLVPSGDFDGDVRAVRHRGGRLELQSIRATPPTMLLQPR